GRVSPRRVLRIALDVAQGLEAGLEQGLIHRDVKPANILMSNRGAARLVDFGLAHRNFVDLDSQRADTSKTVIGTRGYMAPEQALNPDRVTFRADVYALGATLYEAAMGTPLRPRDRYG